MYLSTAGCCAVPVGYYTSPTQHLQWRLSVNKAERILSKSLSNTQRKCYTITKLLVKQFLPKSSILSSYHVKNLMFWLCEEHPPEEWSDGSLGQWIHHLLHYAAVSLVAHNIAQYIVRDNNMIRHRSSKEVINTLKHVKLLIDHPFSSLEKVCTFLNVLDFQQVKLGPQFSAETRSSVLLYVLLVEMLKAKGLHSLHNDDGINAFRQITRLNENAPPGLKKSGIFYTSTELNLMLYNLASAFTKDNLPEDALSLYNALMKEDSKATAKWPDVLVNLACSYNSKSKMVEDEDEVAEMTAMAMSYFQEALAVRKKSTQLHFTYGQFLIEHGTFDEAATHLRTATQLVSDDSPNVFLEIKLPGVAEKKQKQISIPINIASHYFLVQCLLENNEAAADIALKMETICNDVDLREQPECFFLCAQVYKQVGNKEKAKSMHAQATQLDYYVKQITAIDFGTVGLPSTMSSPK